MASSIPTSGFQLFHDGQLVRNCDGFRIYETIARAEKGARRMRRLHGWKCEIRAWSAT